MYLKKTPVKRTGRVYLSIVQGYRDKERGYSTNKVVRKLGYLDDLQKEYDDPIAHFTQVASEMSRKAGTESTTATIHIDFDEKLPAGSDARMNLGYAAILKIFHELKLNTFLRNKQRGNDFEYNTYTIMLLLVISRLLSPASKKRTYEDRTRYFERFDFELHDVYRSLSFFAKKDTQVQRHIHEQINVSYGRNTEFVYYDVTNYYFEIDEEDELRRKGVGKEHRPDPIVQMGLAMDADGLPIAYKLYPGNTNDALTLRPILGELKREYDLGRTIVVADKGINSGDNIYYMKTDNDKDGYVLSFSVRGATDAFKAYVLDETGYYQKREQPSADAFPDTQDGTFKIKSRTEVRYIKVTKADGGKMTKAVDEKQVVYYSQKYADRAKADRAEAVRKARDLCASPSKYNKATSCGAAKYVKNIEFDKDTGEILTSKGRRPVFDEAKLAEEEKYDGYYAIVTSELDKSDDWVIQTYRGLWEIEESFKITKSELETRPIYVSREDHIKAHFLTCFIALVIARLLEKTTNARFPLPQMVEALNKLSCSFEAENIFLLDYRSAITDAIGSAIGVDFNKRRFSMGQIRKILAHCKK